MLSGASSFHCGEEQLLSPPRRALVGLRRLKAGTLNALKDAEGLRRAPWALTVRRSSGRIEGGTAARGANTSRGRLPFFRFITEFRDGAYSESTLEAPPRVATTATAGTAKDAKDAKEWVPFAAVASLAVNWFSLLVRCRRAEYGALQRPPESFCAFSVPAVRLVDEPKRRVGGEGRLMR